MLGQNELAQDDFERAITIEPNNVQAWVSKSDVSQSTGRHEEALEDIQKALMLDSTNLQIQKHALALLLSSSKPYKRRLCGQLIDEALSSNSQDIELRLYKARYLLTKETAPAIKQAQLILQKIIEDQPEIANAWAILAQIYLKQAQHGEAMDTVLHGLKYSPNNKNLLLLKAQTEASLAPTLAIPTMELLNDREPYNAEIVLELAKIYVAAGQYDKSITLLKNLLERCEKKELRKIKTALAGSLYKKGDKNQARQVFDMLYESGTDCSRVFLAETNLLKDDQRWEFLSHRANDWIQHNPNDIDTLTTLAKNLVVTKKEEALNITEKLLRKILHTNPHCPGAMNSLAILLQIRGRHSEAAEIYRQILAIEPEAITAINNLAWIMCEEQGKYQQALELAQRGLQKNHEYIDLIDTRGIIYYRMSKHDKAAKDFTRCLELYPKNSSSLAVSHFHLARAQIALGQNDRARYNLQKAIELNNNIGGLSSTEVSESQNLLDELLRKGGYVYGNN